MLRLKSSGACATYWRAALLLWADAEYAISTRPTVPELRAADKVQDLLEDGSGFIKSRAWLPNAELRERKLYTSIGMMAAGKIFTLKYMWNRVTHDSFRSGPGHSKLPPLAAEKALGDSCEHDVVNNHEWRDSVLLAVNGALCQSLQLIYSSSGQQLQKQSLAYFTVMRPTVLSVFQLNTH